MLILYILIEYESKIYIKKFKETAMGKQDLNAQINKDSEYVRAVSK